MNCKRNRTVPRPRSLCKSFQLEDLAGGAQARTVPYHQIPCQVSDTMPSGSTPDTSGTPAVSGTIQALFLELGWTRVRTGPGFNTTNLSLVTGQNSASDQCIQTTALAVHTWWTFAARMLWTAGVHGLFSAVMRRMTQHDCTLLCAASLTVK